MKKIVLLLVIGITVTFANAQNNAATSISSQNKKTSINITELQKTITDHITKEFAGSKILEAYKLEKGAIAYQVIIEKDAKKVYLYYDKDGKFLSKREGVDKKSESVTPKTKKVNTQTPSK